MDLFVGGEGVPLGVLLSRLRDEGVTATVIMVDGQLHAPGAAVPDGWRDVRLKTPAGMLSVKRRDGGVAIVVFSNADAALVEMQRRIGDLFGEIMKETQ